jgi:hypothetical protein
MATAKQANAARRNVSKAQEEATSKRTIARMPKNIRSALSQQVATDGRHSPTAP